MPDRALAIPLSKRLRRLLPPIAIGIVIVAWGSFIWNQVDTLRAYTWQISPIALVLALVIGAVYYAVLGLGWALLLRNMRQQPIPLMPAVRIWLFSMVSRYIPGNVWHILSRAIMARQLGASSTMVVASASIEQGLTILAAFGIATLTLPGWLDNRYPAAEPGIMAAIVIATLIGLVSLHPHILGRILKFGAARLNQPELAWSYRYRDMLALTLLFVLAHLCSGLALVTILIGTTQFDSTLVPFVIGSAAAAWAIGYLSLITPGGLGVREGVLTGLLALVVPLPVATMASLLFRVVLTLSELLIVLMFWLASRMKKDDPYDISTTQH